MFGFVVCVCMFVVLVFCFVSWCLFVCVVLRAVSYFCFLFYLLCLFCAYHVVRVVFSVRASCVLRVFCCCCVYLSRPCFVVCLNVF